MKLISALAVSLLTLSSCSRQVSVLPDTRPAVESPHYFMAGSVVSENNVQVRSKISSRVTEIDVQIGDHVAKGQILVQLEKNDIRAQLESARKRFENAKLELERTRKLFDGGYVSPQAMETVEYTYKAAETALELAQIQEENCTLVSPIDGTVSAVNIIRGDMASPNAPLLTIVDAENFHVEAYIPETMLNRIQPGMSVDMLINEIHVPGVVSVIDPVVDPHTRNILLKIAVADKLDQIRPGMYALIGASEKRGKS